MREIVTKLKEQEKTMARERGPFDLFALSLREDAPDVWDLLVAGDWIERDELDALKYISQKLKEVLTSDELRKLSRIAIIDTDNPTLDVLHKTMNVEHGQAEIRNTNLFGLQIRRMYLITSQRRNGNLSENTAGDQKS